MMIECGLHSHLEGHFYTCAGSADMNIGAR